MPRPPLPHLAIIAVTALASALIAAPAAAEEQTGRWVLVGGGVQVVPAYPGASNRRQTFLPEVEVWRKGEAMPVESPDEGVGFAVIGKRGSTAIGPALRFAPQRSADDLPGLPAVKFGMELGVFAETYLAKPLRLRAELRHGIGAHRALTGELAADLVLRRGSDGPVATIGPRLRWGSAKYNRAYYGIVVPAPGLGFAAYEPGAGFHAVGAVAGLHLPVGPRWGLHGYAGYDRLASKAARSPIVSIGSRDQLSAGLAMTYRFSL